MKTLFFAAFVLCATAAFSQNGSVLNSNSQPVYLPEHPEHASHHALGQETTLLDTSVYSYAQGEVPLSELGSIEYETPLGDVARALRKERALNAPAKPVKVFEK
jgi:hypothetical protein